MKSDRASHSHRWPFWLALTAFAAVLFPAALAHACAVLLAVLLVLAVGVLIGSAFGRMLRASSAHLPFVVDAEDPAAR